MSEVSRSPRQTRMVPEPGKSLLQRLGLDQQALLAFCQRWQIAELSVFGSVLGDDFGPESDVDVLVRWMPGVVWGLFDHARMEDELEQLLKRRVDILSRAAVAASPNWVIRRSILDSAEPIYVA